MKLVLNDLANLESQTTAVQTINNNNSAIETALENTLSRDGSSPNFMAADLDLNGFRILNLPAPLTPAEPLRLADIGGLLPSDIALAGTYASQAQASAAAAAASATAAAGYVGAATNAPRWTTARVINLFGDLSGTSPAWDGSTDLSFAGITINAGAVDGSKMAVGAAVANLGYTPANLAGATFTGEVRLNYVGVNLHADSAGFRGIPINTQDAIYTTTVDDIGKMVRHTSATGHTYWLDTNAVTPYPVGAAIAFRNVGTGAISLRRGPGVSLRKAGSATDADVTIAQWGFATAVQEASNVWIVTGTGIT